MDLFTFDDELKKLIITIILNCVKAANLQIQRLSLYKDTGC